MYYAKQGYPEDDELVLCTITSVQYNSVFCDIDEYPGKSGMIHISEVTAGRIRNIREYVQEGRKVVCKVLRIDTQKGHIDLSLRRVNERQRREKMAALKQEGKAENLIVHIAKELKIEPKKLYEEVAKNIFKEYEYIHEAFQDIVEGELSLEKTELDKKTATKIEEVVKERIKPAQVSIEGIFKITTFEEKGIEKVKKTLVEAEKVSAPSEIIYLGAGQHKITLVAEEYKDAEKRLKLAIDVVEKAFKKSACTTLDFVRTDND